MHFSLPCSLIPRLKTISLYSSWRSGSVSTCTVSPLWLYSIAVFIHFLIPLALIHSSRYFACPSIVQLASFMFGYYLLLLLWKNNSMNDCKIKTNSTTDGKILLLNSKVNVNYVKFFSSSSSWTIPHRSSSWLTLIKQLSIV